MAEAREILGKIPYVETDEAVRAAAGRVRQPLPKGVPQGGRNAVPVESPCAAARLQTDAAKRDKKVANAEALIWKILMIAEK